MKSELVLAYCTFPNQETATRICEQLVAEGTVACANILPPHQAVYRWNDKIQRETEIGVFLKTAASKKAALKERIRATHPYETPCLIFLKIEDGLPEFLKWVYLQSL